MPGSSTVSRRTAASTAASPFPRPSPPCALFCIGGFAHQTLSGALYTLTSDLFGKHEVGTAVGLTGMSGWLGGMLFSLAVGTLATTIGYNPLFVALAVFDILAAIVVWTLLRDEQARPAPTRQDDERAAAGALGS
ncbi:MFS transporter [Ralstonia sp. UBA689]|uniref:MFS transporter n=1 Tax=Ralstonia sp. UBA689 TaxID=1947373 RepID=UPI0025FEBF1B|nr:MFS transporter [Ralstonia sp. UBA689]